MKTKHLFIPLALGASLALIVLWLLGALNAKPSLAHLAELTVCPAGPPDCGYDTIQAAVDEAVDGDAIKVASGTYTDMSTRSGATQMVHISKTVTIRGGYTAGNWATSDPATNPTTLDAQGQGRVFYILGNISPTIQGLRITGGDATGAGGYQANNAGGGFCIVTATATISNNHIYGNVATTVGGGLYLWTSDATLEGNTITSNTAGISGGGAHLWASDATLRSNHITGNTANGQLSYSSGGGGVYLEDGSDATLINNVIADNSVVNQGGGVYVKGSSPRLLHTTIARNSCTGAIGGRGSGVFVRASAFPCNVVLTNTILSNHGTGIYADTGVTVGLNGVLWYDNTTANTDGDGTTTITNEFVGNPAFAPDGYHLTRDSIAIDRGVNASVTTDVDGDTRSQDGDANGIAAPDLGASEYRLCQARLNDDSHTYPTVQAAVDASSHATDIVKVAGYCVGVEQRQGMTQTLYISKGLTIQGGYAPYDFSSPPNPVASPTTLDAQGGGRVLYVASGANLTVEGLCITGGDAEGEDGGGIYISNASPIIRNNQVFSNTAREGGGLFLWRGAATIDGNSVTSNTANSNGGGLYLEHSNATLSGNTIAGNRVTQWSGGGLFLYASHGTLNDNRITGNNSPDDGGGLFLDESDAMFNENVISHNAAGNGGGGLYMRFSNPVLTNTVVTDNRADGSGSGLLILGSTPRLLHTTIARNHGGDGSGIHVTRYEASYRTTALTNTILASHTVGITVTAGNTATLNGVLWYSNTTNYNDAGAIVVTNEFTGSPAFAADGFHLTADSAAIDRGVNTGVRTDIDGDRRPIGPFLDLGADERRLTVHLPLVLRQYP